VNIVAADRKARALSESEVVALLGEPVLLRLGVVDEDGWPLVHPVWHVFEDGVIRLVVDTNSVKARVLRATPRAYFTVDTAEGGRARGVRGRARARVVDGDVDLAVDVCRKELVKYTGTAEGPFAEEMLGWARAGGMSVVELTPLRLAAFSY
jgi:hypothetical protein